MSLHARLRVLLAIVLLVLFSFNGMSHYRSARNEQIQALREQAERSRGVLMSMRRIYHQQFIDSALELAPETLGFLPAHAMNRISRDISNWVEDGFTFNNVSDFPRNQLQGADARELEVMEFFRSEPAQEVYFERYEDENGDPWYQYARPIWIEDYCLKCHGERSEAPRAIRELYDTSYNYKVGDLRGLLSIRLSARSIENRLHRHIINNVATSLGMFLFSYLVLSFLIHRYVKRPIFGLIEQVNLVAQGDGGARVPMQPGEFSILAESVNNMAQKIEEDRATLLSNEQTYRTLVEGTNAAPWTLDLETRRFIYLGPQFEILLGYSGKDLVDFEAWVGKIHPQDKERALSVFEETVLSQGNHQQEYRMLSAANKEVWVKCVAATIPKRDSLRMIGFLVDITDQKNAELERASLERQMLQAQKMESLGILAGGVAHDFNNLLTGILGNADLALLDLEPGSSVRKDIESVIIASRQAADLANQMLAYSGKGKFIVEKIHVGDLVQEMTHLLKASISRKATFAIECPENLAIFEGDITQIRQVVMNLITNASEAIGESNGKISLTIGDFYCDEDYIQSYDHAINSDGDGNIAEGRYVFLEISDTGCGLDKDTLGKIFDPFFSTKFTGRGLGLAAVLGIVRGHNGAIKVYSEPGQGTTFKILLPEIAVEDFPREIKLPEPMEKWSGTGTILVVDDDPTVRQIATRMLEHLGFQVLQATDGFEALEVYQKQGKQIACVLLDLTMPQMDGKEVFRKIRLLSSSIPVIMTSGYTEKEVIRAFGGEGPDGFIQKPYRADELVALFQKILG